MNTCGNAQHNSACRCALDPLNDRPLFSTLQEAYAAVCGERDALRERAGVLEKALNIISTRECEDYGGSGWNCVEFFRSTAREALTPSETTGEAAPKV